MSNINILNSVSEADKAKLLALAASLLNGEAETAKPKRSFAPKDDSWKLLPISPEQGKALLGLKNGTHGQTARQIDPEGVALTGYWERGEALTFGELYHTEDVRPSGEAGTHYPVLWSLTKGEASEIRAVLVELPALPESDQPKPKASTKPKASGYKPKASNQPKADDSDLRGEVTVLKALMQQLIEQQFRQEPAKPVAPSGHSKKPAKPVAARPAKPVKFDAELGAYYTDREPVELAEGQIVKWQGKLVELTLQANGRIGQKQIG